MPAIMMMPDSGVPDSVTGSSSDIAEIGPMPGSTPTSVPMKTPMKQYSRLIGSNATPNPCATLMSVSMMRSADFEDARRQLDQQEALEDPPHAERGEHGNRDRERPSHRIDDAQQQHHQGDRRQQEAERIEREGECGETGNDQQWLGPARVFPARAERRAALIERRDDDRSRKQAHQDAGIEQHVTGAGIVDGAEFQLEPGPDHEKAGP